MKIGLLCLAALSAVAVAQPHRQHHHARRQDVVTEIEVETLTDVVTATAPNAIVYLNQNGNPTSTSFQSQSASTTTAQQQQNWAPSSSYAAPTVDSTTYVAPVPSSSSSVYTPPPASTSYMPASSSYAAPAPSSSPSSGSGSGNSASGIAIAYSPYNNDNSCKSQDQVAQDFQQISGYGMVRLYGTDCNQTATVLSAVKPKGMQVFAGVYDITQLDSEIQTIIDAANGDWTPFHTIAIGNEGVNDGTYTVDAVVSAIQQANSTLQAAGYKGHVVTVDTFVAMIANPALCQASSYAAANCHAFFDGGVTAEQAGEFVVGQAQRVSQACNGMDTMITESGWPSQGQTNGQAVPSEPNQQAAISALKSSFSNNLILFTAYNDYWKQNTGGTFGAEQYWGVLGNAPSS